MWQHGDQQYCYTLVLLANILQSKTKGEIPKKRNILQSTTKEEVKRILASSNGCSPTPQKKMCRCAAPGKPNLMAAPKKTPSCPTNTSFLTESPTNGNSVLNSCCSITGIWQTCLTTVYLSINTIISTNIFSECAPKRVTITTCSNRCYRPPHI